MHAEAFTFGILDYAVLAGYLVSVLGVGLAFARRQTSLDEYYHGGGNLPWWAVGVSMLANSLTPVTYLASPGWIFVKDSRELGTSVLLATIFLPLTALVWAPLWSRVRVMSIYEYLERRYHASIRSLGAVLFILFQVCWVGTALVTAALGFEKVTGVDGRWCLTVMVLLGATYTVLGGMRALIWTDLAQFIVFMVGYGAVLFALAKVFSWNPREIYHVASTTISQQTGHPHTQLISFELDLTVEATFWVMLLMNVRGMFEFGVNQLNVQLLHSTRSGREMFKSLCGNAISLWMFSLVAIPAAWGIVAFYAKHPELHANVTHPDQIVPDFAVRYLPAGLRSLVMAGVLAALLSTLDSSINSMSNVALSDFYRRYLVPTASEQQMVTTGKILTVVFATILLAFSVAQFDRHGATALEKLMTLTNVIASPLVSFFILGVFSRRTNTVGAALGAMAGIAFAVVFNGIPGIVEKQLDWINWMWVGGLAIIVNVVAGYAASLLFSPPPPESLTDLTLIDRREHQ
jgi:SSS family transporter